MKMTSVRGSGMGSWSCLVSVYLWLVPMRGATISWLGGIINENQKDPRLAPRPGQSFKNLWLVPSRWWRRQWAEGRFLSAGRPASRTGWEPATGPAPGWRRRCRTSARCSCPGGESWSESRSCPVPILYTMELVTTNCVSCDPHLIIANVIFQLELAFQPMVIGTNR